MSQLPVLPADLAKMLANPTDETFDLLASKSAFLPRVQLYGSNSNEVKRGEFPMAHWGLVRNSLITDLGKEVKALNLKWQPLAMQIDNDGIVTCTNPKDPIFDKIVEESKVNETGFMWGFQFLLWVPDQKAFATYFMCNASARREAPVMKSLLAKPIWLQNKLVEKGKFAWHAPVIKPCSEPFEYPMADKLTDAVKSFETQAVAGTEPVKEGETAERAR